MKTEKVQAYITKETKDKIVKIAKDQERSESYVAGKILDKSLAEPPLTLSNYFAKMQEAK